MLALLCGILAGCQQRDPLVTPMSLGGSPVTLKLPEGWRTSGEMEWSNGPLRLSLSAAERSPGAALRDRLSVVADQLKKGGRARQEAIAFLESCARVDYGQPELSGVVAELRQASGTGDEARISDIADSLAAAAGDWGAENRLQAIVMALRLDPSYSHLQLIRVGERQILGAELGGNTHAYFLSGGKMHELELSGGASTQLLGLLGGLKFELPAVAVAEPSPSGDTVAVKKPARVKEPLSFPGQAWIRALLVGVGGILGSLFSGYLGMIGQSYFLGYLFTIVLPVLAGVSGVYRVRRRKEHDRAMADLVGVAAGGLVLMSSLLTWLAIMAQIPPALGGGFGRELLGILLLLVLVPGASVSAGLGAGFGARRGGQAAACLLGWLAPLLAALVLMVFRMLD